jgi:hypothetical protein
VPYGELDALRFKAELEVAQRELEDVSKKADITELESGTSPLAARPNANVAWLWRRW